MTRIDLNSDMGESYGAYKMGDDEALLQLVTTANVACGFHAGDPLVMSRTVKGALDRGVGVGAHPGFNDINGFGRRQIRIDNFVELEKMVVYQIGALYGIAKSCGHEVTHVKFHGAMANMGLSDKTTADALIRAVKSFDRDLVVLTLPHSEIEAAAERQSLRIARELLADRAYDDTGNVVPRKQPGAMITDPEIAAERIIQMLTDRALTSINGKKVPLARMDSICIHGDEPGAVEMANAIRRRLAEANVSIVPLHQLDIA
jgi:UPF0271 protein